MELVDQLLAAVEQGLVEPVLALLAKGVNVNAHDNRGNTALHTACMGKGGHEKMDMALILLEKGALLEDTNLELRTALHIACEKNIDEILSVELISRGANLYAVDKVSYALMTLKIIYIHEYFHL